MTNASVFPMAVEAVLFDLDGTLIDSVGTYYRIVDTVLARLGFPPTSVAEIREAAGN
jgi:phosphoglycolate phosphatase